MYLKFVLTYWLSPVNTKPLAPYMVVMSNDSVTWLCGGRTAAAKCDLLQLWGRVDGHNHRPKFHGLFNQKLRIGVHYKNFFFTIVAMVRSVEPFMVVYGSWLPAP